MSDFRQTLQIALAGVQAPLPAAIAALAAEWGEPDGNPASDLLQAATLLVQAERCAKPLPRPGMPDFPEAALETLAPVSNELATLLGQDVEAPNPWVMLDKASLLVARGEFLPHALLPDWLDFASKHPAERAALMACTGRRGPWLTALNPDWHSLVGPPQTDDTAWDDGSLSQRIIWLSRCRARAPDEARAVLESVWAQESPDAREPLLDCLSIGLSVADEPLLELARKDKRKEVRRLALALLRRLPDSAYTQRMLARLSDWLACTPRSLLRAARLEIRLPAEFDKSWLLEGIPEKSTRQHQGIGDKANWLVEVMGQVPLDRLLAALGITIETWIAMIREHEFSAALWTGSVLSFERHPQAKLLPALCDVPIAPLKATLLEESLHAAAIHPDALGDWLRPWLSRADTDWHLAMRLLPRLDAAHSRALFAALRAYVSGRRADPHPYWAALLPQFSERADATVLADWLAFLDPLGNESSIHKTVDAAAAIASQRQRLYSFHPASRSP